MLYETPYVLQCGRLTGLWTHLVMRQMYLKKIIYGRTAEMKSSGE